MIKVNGHEFLWYEGITVSELLEKKKFTFPKIYVKINNQFIPPENYKITIINDGDDVKVIHLMAGG